jgi:predicted TIM-barrel fold metal-dependent hydrolase
MAIIDMHAHAFPDALAPRAMAALEGPIDWKALGDGTVGGLLRSMDAAGVEASVICNIATKPSQVEPIFKWCTQIASERIIPFPSIHPDTPDAACWMRRFKDAGLRGVKLHPMYQEFAFDEPRMDALYAAVAEAGLVLEPHCGYDIAFPGDGRADADRIARVIDRHPTLKLLCTHLGAWQQWEAAGQHLIGRNVWLETSMSVSLLGLKATADLIRAHGAGKILFGTDWPWTSQTDQINLLRMLDLPKEQIDGILGGNAAKLLGL